MAKWLTIFSLPIINSFRRCLYVADENYVNAKWCTHQHIWYLNQWMNYNNKSKYWKIADFFLHIMKTHANTNHILEVFSRSHLLFQSLSMLSNYFFSPNSYVQNKEIWIYSNVYMPAWWIEQTLHQMLLHGFSGMYVRFRSSYTKCVCTTCVCTEFVDEQPIMPYR